MSKYETEIDQIRLKLYEETKHLTITEHTRRTNELARKQALQYGFTVQQFPASNSKKPPK